MNNDSVKLLNKMLALNFHAHSSTSPLNKYQTVRTNTISCSDIQPFDYCNPLSACEASEARGSRGMKMSLKGGGRSFCARAAESCATTSLVAKLPLKKPPELLNRRIRIACFITYNKQTVGLHCESAVK